MTATPSRRASLAALITALAIGATAAAASAASFGPTNFGPIQVLRRAPAGDDLLVQDLAARGRDVAVAWHEQDAGGVGTYLRWSRDAGNTFQPRKQIPLDGRLGGINVDVCGGSAWVGGGIDEQTGKGGTSAHLYQYRLGAGATTQTTLDGFGFDVDVACGGDRFVAVAWLSNPPHANGENVGFAVLSMGHVVVYHHRFDLDNVDSTGPTVSATPGSIQVAWMSHHRLRLKRFTVGPGRDLTITKHPTTTLMKLVSGDALHMASDRRTVVLAYYDRADVRARISHDHGRTFEPRQIIWDEPFGGEIAAAPESVDVKGSRILIEAAQFNDGCAPSCLRVSARGFLSTDGGTTWSRSSAHGDGIQVGALFKVDGTPSIGEAWDNAYLVPAPLHQKLRFHVGPI